jgi:hypothetical protein
MASQTTDTVVMVTPDQFRWEDDTAADNKYMRRPEDLTPPISAEDVPSLALAEFRAMVQALHEHHIFVLVLRSPWQRDTPAAVFPNNWFSHHGDRLVLYPMRAQIRRDERQPAALRALLEEAGIPTPEVLDLSQHEDDGLALEGTGSLVLDRVRRVAFAVESPRTSEVVFREWCRRMEYEPVFFHALDAFGETDYPIYHTNVVMSIGEQFAVVCPDTIKDATERAMVQRKLASLDKEVIEIDGHQLRAYCANLLQLRTTQGGQVIVLSQTALHALRDDQRERLARHGTLVPVAIPVIEGIGGGSARCMLAEVYR